MNLDRTLESAGRALRLLAGAALISATASWAAAAEIVSTVDAGSLSQSRQTSLGLYLTPRDAGAALAADSGIVFIDVRTQAEFQFVGHPEPVDQNIPILFLDPALEYDGKRGYGMIRNPAFGEKVAALMQREGKGLNDPIFVICRSGGRSARAVDALAALGYTKVWNLIEGFEGEKDPMSGHRTVDGWRNADLPWSYDIRPEQAYVD